MTSATLMLLIAFLLPRSVQDEPKAKEAHESGEADVREFSDSFDAWLAKHKAERPERLRQLDEFGAKSSADQFTWVRQVEAVGRLPGLSGECKSCWDLLVAMAFRHETTSDVLRETSFSIQVLCDEKDAACQSLRVAAELRLRQLGIAFRDQSPSSLRIAVNTVCAETTCAYVVETGLNEFAFPMKSVIRPEPVVRMSQTWSANGSIGLAPKDELNEVIKEAVVDQIDEFANEYLKANEGKLDKIRSITRSLNEETSKSKETRGDE